MADADDNIEEQQQDRSFSETKSSNVPLILTLLVLTVYFGFQTLQFASERGNLAAVKSNQEAAIQEAQKVQAQFKALVTRTGQLADQGHAGARMVMEELQKRGIGFSPQAMPPETKAPAKAETKSGR
jgi:flagellar basal body-associated protein FliL